VEANYWQHSLHESLRGKHAVFAAEQDARRDRRTRGANALLRNFSRPARNVKRSGVDSIAVTIQ